MKKILIGLAFLMSVSLHAETILYIGDSHSYIRAQHPEINSKRFGNVFIEGMKARDVQVDYYAACGSAPIGWYNGSRTNCGFTSWVEDKFVSITNSPYPGLKSIYNPSKHSKIIINLGDNMFEWKSISGKNQSSLPPGTVQRGLKAFLSTIPSITPTTCTWIGPTYHIEGSIYRKTDSSIDELYRQLEEALADKCIIIDSRPIVKTTVPNDGLHHTNADSEAWALGVLGLIQ